MVPYPICDSQVAQTVLGGFGVFFLAHNGYAWMRYICATVMWLLLLSKDFRNSTSGPSAQQCCGVKKNAYCEGCDGSIDWKGANENRKV